MPTVKRNQRKKNSILSLWVLTVYTKYKAVSPRNRTEAITSSLGALFFTDQLGAVYHLPLLSHPFPNLLLNL
jgi:hypothetical protein